MKRLCFVMIMLLLLRSSLAQATTYYVATTGNDASPGTQAQPFRTIGKGIAVAAAGGDTLLVLQGVYAERLTWSNKSLLLLGSGAGQKIIDAGGTGRCLTLTNVPSTARIEGFTIQNGNGAEGKGGGMYLINSSPSVKSCRFLNNQAGYGGGMYNDDDSSPKVSDCEFTGNNADDPPWDGRGGGMFNGDGSVVVYRCSFNNNSSTAYGGGMHNQGGYHWVANCRFTGNHSDRGGGMGSISSNPAVMNCLFINNNAGVGGGMYDYTSITWVTNCTLTGNNADLYGGGLLGGSTTVNNCIVWGNTASETNDLGTGWAVNNTCVRGGWPGSGNIDADPQFIGGGNYRLQSTSPCINRGDANAPHVLAEDLEGRPRILGPAPDMGAYEFWSSAYGQWFVDKATGNDSNNGAPLAPFKTVVKAINTASNGHRIYIKQGNYGTDRPRITKSLRLFNWLDTGLSRIGQP